jgi:hypothetical protein
MFGQDRGGDDRLFNVHCSLSDAAVSGDVITVKFEVAKNDGYVGPLTIVQKLPHGFTLLNDAVPFAKVSSGHQQFEVFWQNLPLGNTFSVELQIAIGNISQAVYPFQGSAHFYGFSVSYGSYIMIGSARLDGSVDKREGKVPPIEIFFELPEKIVPGVEFTFVTSFKKQPHYLASGTISHKWPDMFQPKSTKLTNATINISNNNVELSWEKLDTSTYFSIAYQVHVNESANGAYPVISHFEDENGLKLIETLGVFVDKDVPKEAAIITEKEEHIQQLWFEYPTIVAQGSPFEIMVFIQKGKNTGPGSFHLKLPSGCEINDIDTDDFSYKQANGNLIITWDRLPANPVVEIKIDVKTRKATRAVYMMLGEFYQDGKLLSSKSGHLFITDEVQLEEMKEAEEEIAKEDEINTTEVFSKIDSLLIEWKQSTGGNIQVNPDQVKPAIENYRVQILASTHPLPNVKKLLLSMNVYEPLNVHYDGEYYRYTLGKFNTAARCAEYVKFIRSKGFADAFVRKYVGDEPEQE